MIEGKVIYFYSETCPHRANVEAFLKENNIESKLQFAKKEVSKDRLNTPLFFLVAQRKCNLPVDQIGVPFLWSGSSCIIGEGQVIDFFKANISS